MSRGIFIIGTDTEVGKTVVSAGLMYLLLKNGFNAVYFKPVVSGEIDLQGVSVPADAAFVCAVSGLNEDIEKMTPFSFADAVAPHLAARLEHRTIDTAVIQKSLNALKNRYDVIIGEGAGGLAVPLNDEGYMQHELIRELGFSCLLVARAGLGTINHTLLTLRVAKSVGLTIKGIIISGVGQTLIEQDNVVMIKKLSGVNAVFTLPTVVGVGTEKMHTGNLRDVFEQTINIDDIVGLLEIV